MKHTSVLLSFLTDPWIAGICWWSGTG